MHAGVGSKGLHNFVLDPHTYTDFVVRRRSTFNVHIVLFSSEIHVQHVSARFGGSYPPKDCSWRVSSLTLYHWQRGSVPSSLHRQQSIPIGVASYHVGLFHLSSIFCESLRTSFIPNWLIPSLLCLPLVDYVTRNAN
jgi:hypothetical protein